MDSTVDSRVIDAVKAEAAQFVQRHGPVSDLRIYEEASAVAERLIPTKRMWDGALWKTLLWLSVAAGILMGIAAAASGGGGFGFVLTGVLVFGLCMVPSLMIAFGAWMGKPQRAEAQRSEIGTAWTMTANRYVILHQQEAAERAETERVQRLLSRPSPPPAPQPYGVSAEGAERIVEAWMRHLGALDSEVTRYTGDGGIDVTSASWIAQVKHYQGVIGVAPVRELAGVAAVDGRRALFFTSTGYAAGAAEFADRAGIGLFTYSAEEGTLTAMNEIAEELYERGLAG